MSNGRERLIRRTDHAIKPLTSRWTPESHFPHQEDNAHHSNSNTQSTQTLTKDQLRFQHRHVCECNLAQRFAKEWANTHSLRPHHPYLEFLAIHANKTVPNLPDDINGVDKELLEKASSFIFSKGQRARKCVCLKTCSSNRTTCSVANRVAGLQSK